MWEVSFSFLFFSLFFVLFISIHSLSHLSYIHSSMIIHCAAFLLHFTLYFPDTDKMNFCISFLFHPLFFFFLHLTLLSHYSLTAITNHLKMQSCPWWKRSVKFDCQTVDRYSTFKCTLYTYFDRYNIINYISLHCLQSLEIHSSLIALNSAPLCLDSLVMDHEASCRW